jgi:S-adenosylmethionine-diacylglycerol 3-amino-3-carboxypropyl transferase
MAAMSDWLEEAAALPLAFALVREDALLDEAVVLSLPAPVRVLMIASGGCTAALLSTLPAVRFLHLVDPNPAQLALARLKILMAHAISPEDRLTCLGHEPDAAQTRPDLLRFLCDTLQMPLEVLGPPTLLLEEGADHAGRYERLFVRLRQVLAPHESELHALLNLTDPDEQARRVQPGAPLGDALEVAYDDVLALPNLVRLFGEGATRNPVEPFARHFLRRTRATLAALPAATNPYLWQMLRSRLPPGVSLPWLTRFESRNPFHHPPADYTWTQAFMADVLADTRPEYDLVHLSNILDWLSPAEATHTLELASRALRPGGVVLIRQLNSSLDIPALGPMFEWDRERCEDLHRRDRSFFYRHLYLGKKP